MWVFQNGFSAFRWAFHLGQILSTTLLIASLLIVLMFSLRTLGTHRFLLSALHLNYLPLSLFTLWFSALGKTACSFPVPDLKPMRPLPFVALSWSLCCCSSEGIGFVAPPLVPPEAPTPTIT